MFSGRDVFAHQIVAQGGRQELDPAIRLLPSLLGEHGYFTAAVDNIGRWIAPAFQRYVEYPRWDHDGSQPWRNGEEVTRRGLALLEEAAPRQPFFLFLHYWDPHTPYLPPLPFDRMFYDGKEKDPTHRSMEPVWQSPWFRNYFSEWLAGVTDIEFVRAQYDASIAYTDHCLAPILERLEAHDLADTLLLVLADHGEELDEHGCWFDHHGLYETNVRVPLLLRPPGMNAGAVRADLTTLLDLAPTVLAAGGLPDLAAAHEMPGWALLTKDNGPQTTGALDHCEDRLPVVRGPLSVVQPNTYLTECTWMRKRGWRTPAWKFIEALEPDIYGKPPFELYNLAADPGETRSLADEYPETVAELRAQMRAWIERRQRETGHADPLVEQSDALRIWQPRFIAGRTAP